MANEVIHAGLAYDPVVTTPLVAVAALPVQDDEVVALPVTLPVKFPVIVLEAEMVVAVISPVALIVVAATVLGVTLPTGVLCNPPVADKVPTTDKVCAGLAVPMPTLPAEVSTTASVNELPPLDD